jgi:ABC-type branched-subunit amino acid transport system ATPase component
MEIECCTPGCGYTTGKTTTLEKALQCVKEDKGIVERDGKDLIVLCPERHETHINI